MSPFAARRRRFGASGGRVKRPETALRWPTFARRRGNVVYIDHRAFLLHSGALSVGLQGSSTNEQDPELSDAEG